jgi:DNA polymerase III delta prime subunit
MSAEEKIVDLRTRRGVTAENDSGEWEIPPVVAYADDAEAVTPAVTLADFSAYMPAHQYIFAPNRELWPAASVNERLPSMRGPDGKSMKASQWLDQNQPVEQMTWAPGMPTIIEDRLVSNGGWIDRPGCRCFNLYLPPRVEAGYADAVEPWLNHIRLIYPTDWEHIVKWLAHRVQRPGEKINHALVLGGPQGIGKDTMLEPVKYAVGPWNVNEVSPQQLLGRFNSFVKSVILRISEARDLGEVDRFAFYDHTKVYTAAPPDVLRCDEKHLREHAVMNVCGVIITTNYKGDGIYLPSDDRRHYVAWSTLSKEDFPADYWQKIYGWYSEGGMSNVAAYLAGLDLSDFDPKAPPPKTAAFWEIVDSNRSQDDSDLADVLDVLGNPEAVTLGMITQRADDAFRAWLLDRKNRRQIPHRLETAGYVPVRNDADKHDGQWKVAGKRQTIYARKELSHHDRIVVANEICREGRR